MKATPAAWLLLLLTLPTFAQTPPPPAPPTFPSAALEMDTDERQFFALGTTLAQGAFAYAELAKQAAAAGKGRGKTAQIGQWEKLGLIARRNRRTARDGFARALSLMQTLDAPPAALAPIARAAARLGRPILLTADARPLAAFDMEAAQTLSALGEFAALSSLPETPALRQWLASPAVSASAQVWYDEGEISGLAQIAAAHQMPDLLPPAEQLTTDLRGLRDWLALRLPDTPSPEQRGLKSALEAFLQQAALTERPGVKSRKLLSLAQLQALGSISRQLQTQVLGPEGSITQPPPPAPPPQAGEGSQKELPCLNPLPARGRVARNEPGGGSSIPACPSRRLLSPSCR